MNSKKYIILGAVLLSGATMTQVYAQNPLMDNNVDRGDIFAVLTDTVTDDRIYESVADSLFNNVVVTDTLVSFKPLPVNFYVVPPIFVSYILPGVNDTPKGPFDPDYSGVEALRWLEDYASVDNRRAGYMQYMAVHTPYAIKYNMDELPEPPKKYEVVINPQDYTIDIREIKPEQADVQATAEPEDVKRKHWLHTFNASLQFSQAYVSPNWYQGGNNNVNMLFLTNYNIKLNQKFHPNYLFETNFSYKLGVNSVQDDPMRNYNISEDIFQFNTMLGIKAIKKWYYTFNAQFKTQLLNSYAKGTNTLRAALFSPGELNAGIGMTYNTTNTKKTFTLDASISPLSYNLMICTNPDMDETAFGIQPGHKGVSKYGSSAEVKIKWLLTKNISLQSRLFGFTDYSKSAYADMENTVVFEINKYLTTQVYVHLRYDTHTPKVDPEWHKLQVKEILSLGLAYKFSTI